MKDFVVGKPKKKLGNREDNAFFYFFYFNFIYLFLFIFNFIFIYLFIYFFANKFYNTNSEYIAISLTNQVIVL